jgi:putative sterol carrier protein
MGTVGGATWRTTSYSGTNGNCVEVADAEGTVKVRDTQDRAGAVLTLSVDTWRAFLDAIK